MTPPLLRAVLLAGLLAAATPLGGCASRRVEPTVSRAVLDARAHRDVARAAACTDLASPASVGFGFAEAKLADLATPDLQAIVTALACHPAARAVIIGAADAHGGESEQRALAAKRAAAVSDYLQAHGIAADRLSVQAKGPAPPGGPDLLVVMAEGRRW
jgi:outer membrane protein OmpA-like peptidoglycan-associated protein